MPWLWPWTKRVKLTIDSSDVSAALTDFPILVYLSASSGRNSDDMSFIFDTLGDNSKKIAVTTDDGFTECYVEVEEWDATNEEAWLWVKVPSISDSADTMLYLYYDGTVADNDNMVGDPDSTAAENVWDSDFKFVSHMRDDPDTSSIRDSTSNNNDGTKGGAAAPAVSTNGKISDAQLFDGNNDYILLPISGTLNVGVGTQWTVSFWMKTPQTVDENRQLFYYFIDVDNRIYVMKGTDGNLRWQFEGQTVAESNEVSMAAYDDVWTRVEYRWNFVSTVIEYSLNGMAYTASDTPATVLAGAQVAILISRFQDPLDGLVDEFRISNTYRSNAWVAASYESERDDLVAYGNEEVVSTPTPYRVGRGIRWKYDTTPTAILREHHRRSFMLVPSYHLPQSHVVKLHPFYRKHMEKEFVVNPPRVADDGVVLQRDVKTILDMIRKPTTKEELFEDEYEGKLKKLREEAE